MAFRAAFVIVAGAVLLYFGIALSSLSLGVKYSVKPLEKSLPVESGNKDVSRHDIVNIKKQRPFMDVTLHSFLDAIYAVEKTRNVTDRCSMFGGVKYIEALVQSAKPLLSNRGSSQIVHYIHDNKMEFYHAQNVLIEIQTNDNKRSYHLKADATMKGPFVPLKDGTNTVLKNMTYGMQGGASLPCQEYIEYPVMIVDDNVYHWNWWFFHLELLKHFIMYAILQPLVAGPNFQVAHTTIEGEFARPFTEAFDFLFTDHHTQSVQLWNLPGSQQAVGGTQQICFRNVFWSANVLRGADRILINRKHQHNDCFSSIVYAYTAILKASMHIPTLPRPKLPRIVWVARDTSLEANKSQWQRNRIISNQPQVIEYLKGNCAKMGIELVVAEFYGEKAATPVLEQAYFASRANIMIGVHGAGLNLFAFMPSNSVVVEVHFGPTTVQMNSKNTVTHIGNGKYLSVVGRKIMPGNKLDPAPVWEKLKEAIQEWRELA